MMGEENGQVSVWSWHRWKRNRHVSLSGEYHPDKMDQLNRNRYAGLGGSVLFSRTEITGKQKNKDNSTEWTPKSTKAMEKLDYLSIPT